MATMTTPIATEQERISALQPHDHAARTRLGDHQPLDELLRRRAASPALSDGDDACSGPHEGEHLVAHQVVCISAQTRKKKGEER